MFLNTKKDVEKNPGKELKRMLHIIHTKVQENVKVASSPVHTIVDADHNNMFGGKKKAV